jgi:hypothetical protein
LFNTFFAGGYLLFEAAGTINNEVARVISTPVTNKDRASACLKFWYHMYGEDVGELTVLQRNLSSKQDGAIWQLHGDQMDMWHQGRVKLDGSDPFQV